MFPERLPLLGCFLLWCLVGCQPSRTSSASFPEERQAPAWFEDITQRGGIDAIHQVSDQGTYRMPRVMGSGGAFLDIDQDGRLDIYLIQNGGPTGAKNRLYLQRDAGQFTDASPGSGLDIAGYGMGVAVGDMNNDGWVDVYVSQYGGGRLFLNQRADANGVWRGCKDVSAMAGIEHPRWGTSCAFTDFDRDGWLDLVVVNYVDYDPSFPCGDSSSRPDFCHPSTFPGTATRLFRNRGNAADGNWRGYDDVTVAAGLAKQPGPGLGVLCSDFDGDGWIDLFIANDAKPNHLWINRRDGTFQEEGFVRGVALHFLGRPQANMGTAFGDIDGDGLFDLFVTHLTEETHTFWRQSPRGRFTDATARTGLASPRWRATGFGTAMTDFDHDGALDLAIVNGRVARGNVVESSDLPEFWRAYAERNQLFVNQGDGTFRDVSPSNSAFCGTPAVSRGLCWGDFDNDGAIDLLVTAIAGPAKLYRNIAPKNGHWLMVRAYDAKSNRDLYGSRITIAAGSRRWIREVNPGQSYLSSGDPRVHFGLGTIDRIDGVRVDWPDGKSEEFTPPELDRAIKLVKGQGKAVAP